jgi:hypothetical protein
MAEVAEIRCREGKTRRPDPLAARRWVSRNMKKDVRRIGRFMVVPKERYRRRAMADYIDDKLARVEENLGALDERVTEEVKLLRAAIRRVEAALRR